LLAHIPGATSRVALNLPGPNLMTCSANLQRVTNADEPLEGLRLLIVEDDYFVASQLASSLRLRGASIVGPAGNVRRARELLFSGLAADPKSFVLPVSIHAAVQE